MWLLCQLLLCTFAYIREVNCHSFNYVSNSILHIRSAEVGN